MVTPPRTEKGATPNPLLVALDLPTAEEATRMAQRLAPFVGGFKVGLELITGPGPAVIAAIVELGKPVFADVKLHDIPNTAERAARNIGRTGARWVTVHAAGGTAMMRAAVSGLADGSGGRAGVLAVTVLTSLDAQAVTEIGVTGTPGKQVARLSRLAASAGVEGIVCSIRELGDVAQVAPGLTRVTPGVRPTGSSGDDQARTAGPAEAIERGADLLVVGRPITLAADPEAAAREISAEITRAASRDR